MRIAHTVCLLAVFVSPCLIRAAQSPAAAPQPAPSQLLQPALDTVQQTLGALKIERWKKGTVRDEAGDNVAAILRDLQANVPPLLQAADAAPGAVSALLPVSRHIDALYDVLLRVVEASRVSAPGDQVDTLQKSLLGLGNARLSFSDRMQAAALALEKQVADLQTTVQAQAAAAKCPVVAAPVCPSPAPAHKVVKKRKPAAKTAQTQQKKPATAAPTTGTGK